jgi:uncharacterized surface protein with fasciclin (FAS1) repeats
MKLSPVLLLLLFPAVVFARNQQEDSQKWRGKGNPKVPEATEAPKEPVAKAAKGKGNGKGKGKGNPQAPEAPEAPKEPASKGAKAAKGKGKKKGKGNLKSSPTSAPTAFEPAFEPSFKPTSEPTSAPTPFMSIAEFILTEPDLDVTFLALQRLDNVELELSELEFIFDGAIPPIGPPTLPPTNTPTGDTTLFPTAIVTDIFPPLTNTPTFSSAQTPRPTNTSPPLTNTPTISATSSFPLMTMLPTFSVLTMLPTPPSSTVVRRRLKFNQSNPLRRTNIIDILSEPGSFTFFAPTNNAFKSLPVDLLSILFLLDDYQSHLADLILYHGLVGARVVKDFRNNERIASFNTENVLIRKNPLRINGIGVSRPDIAASNGISHIIRGVLQPDWVTNSILDFVSSMSDLSLLLEFLVLAELDELVDEFPQNTKSALTLLGPTNSAFQALGEATLTFLGAPANKQTLIRILEYHVVVGVVNPDELVDGDILDTPLNIEVSVVGQTIEFNQATVVSDIILTNNGALYKIDAVLNPDSLTGF